MNNKTLVIYAHPSKDWHCGTILKKVISELRIKKIDFEVLDLYAMKFNPLLQVSEHFSTKGWKVLPDVLKIQKKITESDRLIFIYPIWWYSMPAMMKGFYERVLSSGFAYKYKRIFFGKIRYSQKLLKGKKAVYINTSGSAKSYFLFVPMLWANALITCGTIRMFSGIKYKIFHHGNAYWLTDEVKVKLDKVAIRAVKWLYR